MRTPLASAAAPHLPYACLVFATVSHTACSRLQTMGFAVRMARRPLQVRRQRQHTEARSINAVIPRSSKLLTLADLYPVVRRREDLRHGCTHA